MLMQTEIVKRMSAIIGQVLPFLSQEHQQQVATAVERAKQVTMADLSSAIGAGAGAAGAVAAAGQRPDIARLMQLHAQAQAGQQAANLASLVNGPPGLPGLPPGAALGLPPGLQGLPPGLNIPTSLSSSLLQGLPTSIAASLGGLGPNPLHPALSMLKPQLPVEPSKREDEMRKSLSESNGR